MKSLITSSTTFGPFSNIEPGEDRWHCDGTDYPFSVIGDATVGEWVEPPPPPPIPPASVTMRQARLALLRAGLLSTVNAAVAAMPGPAGDEARIAWEFSSVVEREMPLVVSLTAGLGWTTDQLDALFIEASTL